MSYAEKRSWVFLVVMAVTFLAYVAVVLGRARDVPIPAVAYAWPMIGAIGAAIVLTLVGSILVAMVAAKDGERRFEPDERDAGIERYGDVVGYIVLSICILGALGLTMAGVAHFWIGNAIYLSFFVASQVGTVAKLVAYRRGFPSW